MAMTIKILPEEVASQIAAGEVVERPASVVKELIENSLDAGATRISISIVEAGKSLIQVTDNGSGVIFDELPMAVARHATSKLQKVDDLLHIQTLGFRGEALASIASVSRMTLTSKIHTDNVGGRLKMEGSQQILMEKASATDGATILVEDLFYNMPARLKFLRKNTTEKQQSEIVVSRYALAYPNVSFELRSDGKTVLQTTGNGDKREILYQIYGPEIGRKLIEIQFQEGEYQVSGFISPATLTRSNRKEIIFFVNGRWIQDTNLNTALVQGYHSLLMVGRFPMGTLFLNIPGEEVDVNIHPAKAAVRFRQPDRLFALIQRTVKRTLLANNPFPEINLTTWQWRSPNVENFQSDFPSPKDTSKGEDNQSNPQNVQISSSNETRSTFGEIYKLPLLRVVGQIALAYIIAEGSDGLYLIDQHAAHERVLFEKLTLSSTQKSQSQPLLEAIKLEIPPTKAQTFLEMLPTLNHLGFSIEPFGSSSFLVRAIPALFTGTDPTRLVYSVMEEFEEDEFPLAKELEKRLAARICKKAAVKTGKPLSIEEQRRLIEDLERCENPRNCPHGRPTMIHLSAALLERQFGRKGSV
jgi:DNA mismatch repair protein MutL